MSEEDVARTEGEVVDDETRDDTIQPTYFFSQDGDLLRELEKDPDLKNLRPLYSALMRLTKISSKEKDIFNIDVDLIVGSMIIGMKKKEFNAGRWAKLESNGMFLKTVINDSHKGFKMTLLSRLRKEVVLSREKGKGMFAKLRGQ